MRGRSSAGDAVRVMPLRAPRGAAGPMAFLALAVCLPALLGGAADAQSICTVGKFLFAEMPDVTIVLPASTSSSFSFSSSSPSAPSAVGSASSLAGSVSIPGGGDDVRVRFQFCTNEPGESCTASPTPPGYVEMVTVAGTCLDSFPVITTPLTAINDTTTYYVVSNTAETAAFTVTMVCNSRGAPLSVTLVDEITQVTLDGVTSYYATFSSPEACQQTPFFCETDDDCVGVSCVNGICFDRTCATISDSAQRITSPANFISVIRIVDCYGAPLQNLTSENISVSINGSPIDGPGLAGEADSVVEQAPTYGRSQITTLMIDQSRSVTLEYEETLKSALLSLLSELEADGSNNNFVALAVFDGAATPQTLQSHTNDFALLKAAVNSLPVDMPDPSSSNLNGAIVFGLKASHEMKFAFDELNGGDAVTSLVLFTDGFDTSARVTADNAIVSSQLYAELGVSVLALGIANSSDAAFLQEIATSGFFDHTSTDELVAAFIEVARRLISLRRDSYYVLLCIPMRTGIVPVNISLSPPELYPNTPTLTYTFSADNFTGGCTEEMLREEVNGTGSGGEALPGSSSVYLPIGETVSTMVAPLGAFFFHTNCSSADCFISVLPFTPIFSLNGTRCVLSRLCYDQEFNSTFFITDDNMYYFLLTSRVNRDSVFTIATGYLDGSTELTSSSDSFSDQSFWMGQRDLAGEADRTAIILFAVFAFLIVVAVAVCLVHHVATVYSAHEGPATYLAPPPPVEPQYYPAVDQGSPATYEMNEFTSPPPLPGRESPQYPPGYSVTNGRPHSPPMEYI